MQNAAGIVSISTVARTVPWSMPSRRSAWANTSFHRRASRSLSSFGR